MKYRVKPMYSLSPKGEPELDYHVQRKKFFGKWETLEVYDRLKTAEAAKLLYERAIQQERSK